MQLLCRSWLEQALGHRSSHHVRYLQLNNYNELEESIFQRSKRSCHENIFLGTCQVARKLQAYKTFDVPLIRLIFNKNRYSEYHGLGLCLNFALTFCLLPFHAKILPSHYEQHLRSESMLAKNVSPYFRSDIPIVLDLRTAFLFNMFSSHKPLILFDSICFYLSEKKPRYKCGCRCLFR